VQARRIVLQVVGRTNGARVILRFRTGDVVPFAAQDLGAFLETIETLRFTLPEPVARETKSKRIVTPNGDVFASTTTVRLRG
jgi:hypothetical protein